MTTETQLNNIQKERASKLTKKLKAAGREHGVSNCLSEKKSGE